MEPSPNCPILQECSGWRTDRPSIFPCEFGRVAAVLIHGSLAIGCCSKPRDSEQCFAQIVRSWDRRQGSLKASFVPGVPCARIATVGVCSSNAWLDRRLNEPREPSSRETTSYGGVCSRQRSRTPANAHGWFTATLDFSHSKCHYALILSPQAPLTSLSFCLSL